MASGKISRIGAVPVTNGNIDLNKTPVLIVDIIDKSVTGNAHFDVVIANGGSQQKVFYVDRNQSAMYLLNGYATISNGTLTLSQFKRSQTNSATMTDVTTPEIHAIYGIGIST